jgi:hypothetical protein
MVPSSRWHFVLWYGSIEPLFTLILCCRANIIGTRAIQPKIARIISIASGVLWWQYATYASSCIMTKASSGYHMQCTHLVCHSLEGVWLLALPKTDWGNLPRKDEHLPLNCFQFYPSRLSSDDMSTGGWSLVKLSSALLHLFHANGRKLLWYMLCCFQE